MTGCSTFRVLVSKPVITRRGLPLFSPCFAGRYFRRILHRRLILKIF